MELHSLIGFLDARPKRTSLILLLSLLVPCLGQTLAAGSSAGPGAAGHWEGEITLPTTPLQVRIDLENRSGEWKGTIDIPVQALRGFKLSKVEVKDGAVGFAMAGIPGEPTFKGALGKSGSEIKGDFTQGGQSFPFKLERKAKAPAPNETPAKGVPGKGLAGHWQGTLQVNAMIELRLVLEITNNPAGKMAGVMISVDQGNTKTPITSFTETAGAVEFEIGSVNGKFSGKFNTDGSELAGEWSQGPDKLPLVFRRLARAPTFSRPQDPKKPYPYNEEEVLIENKEAKVKLAGTFTWPRDRETFPAVILITGSGAQDRDEAIMGHRPFLVLADHLTRKGIAVLRCDDRGFGKSTGKFASATQSDFVSDTLAQIDWLRTRKGVNPKKIGLIGHSEGGMIAPRAAVKSKDVAFMVLLAGPGVPMEELLVRQGRDLSRAMGVGEETLAVIAANQREIFAIIKQNEDAAGMREKIREIMTKQTSTLTPEQKQALGYGESMMEQQVKMVCTPWFRDLLTYDLRPILKAVRCPVLALNGEKDLQVAAKENLSGIREHVLAGGNSRVKTMELPGLNHLLQKCQTGAVTEYATIEETMNLEALKIISEWILETTGR